MPGVLPALNPPMSIINCTLLHMSFAISVTFSLILINFFVSLIADNEEKSQEWNGYFSVLKGTLQSVQPFT